MRRAAILLAGLVSSACAGQGTGRVSSNDMLIPVCQLGPAYDLHPSFFGANRDGDGSGASFTIRIQNGGGTEDYSDALVITIDDTGMVRQQIAQQVAAGHMGATLSVGPRGVPGIIVHANFTPDHSCGRVKDTRIGQVVGLWADNDATHTSTITFASIDDPGGTHFTNVTAFSFWMHDPRALGPAPLDQPRPSSFMVNGTTMTITNDTPVGSATLTGSFSFEYSRQVPAQFFP